MKVEKYLVRRERQFSAHHLLMGSAYMALEHARETEEGRTYNQLIAITFSALALESIANTFGERVIPKWDHFESSTPIAKLRVVASHLNVKIDSFGQEPWTSVAWLMKFRNKVAHAKPEEIFHEKIMTKEELQKSRLDTPTSKFESEISLSNAERAVKVPNSVLKLFVGKIQAAKIDGLFGDGWNGSTSIATQDDLTKHGSDL